MATYLDNGKGFTLIELMVAIAILGLVVQFLVSNFIGQMPQHRLNGATRQIAWDLMGARIQAISQNNEVKVTFEVNNHEYTIWSDTDGDGVVDNGETETKDIQEKYYDVSFSTAPTNNVTFQPRGTATNPLTITLSNPAASSDISVSITGKVKIN
jgi:type II secretion system protein H